MAIVRTDDQYYHDIADAIREKTGGTEDILPENMADELNAATLEELYVTPSSSEQTFTPESPCIGFSVVTVEAAPDTGGGDIVEPEELPNGETTTFGYIYTNETETITRYAGIEFPGLPTTEERQYCVVWDFGTYYVCDISNKKWRYNPNKNTLPCGGGTGSTYHIRIWNEDGEAWNTGQSSSTPRPANSDNPKLLYTNHDITYTTDSTQVWMAAMEPEIEEIVHKYSEPVSREDEYRMLGDTMNELCHLAQEASKSEELMTPAAALEILSGVVASLTT